MKIDESLNLSVAAFNWLLPADHIMYKTYKRSVCRTTVSNVLHSIHQLEVCAGIPVDDHSSVAVIPLSNESENIVRDTIPHSLKSMKTMVLPSMQNLFCNHKIVKCLVNLASTHFVKAQKYL